MNLGKQCRPGSDLAFCLLKPICPMSWIKKAVQAHRFIHVQNGLVAKLVVHLLSEKLWFQSLSRIAFNMLLAALFHGTQHEESRARNLNCSAGVSM